MSKPSPITHNGALCNECTTSSRVHANNVHLTTSKAVTTYTPCAAGCQHPLAIQPVGRKFQALNEHHQIMNQFIAKTAHAYAELKG